MAGWCAGRVRQARAPVHETVPMAVHNIVGIVNEPMRRT